MLTKSLVVLSLMVSVAGAEAREVTRTHVASENSAFDPAVVHQWVQTYFEGTRSMDASVWASAFAPQAVLDDPVGFPVKNTPEEILAQGEGFVNAFQEIGLFESFVHVVSNEAVAKWQGRGVTPDGLEVSFHGINHFTFNEDGQITTLRGFFSPPGQ